MGPPAVMDAGMSPPLLWAGPGTGLRERESFLSPELSAGPLGDRIRKGEILEISRGPLAHSSASRQELLELLLSGPVTREERVPAARTVLRDTLLSVSCSLKEQNPWERNSERNSSL